MSAIKLIILDVDGTLTNGKITFDYAGREYKDFNVKDGMGIKLALNRNIEVVILSGRISKVVEIRAKELGISALYQGVMNKRKKVEEIAREKNILLKDIAFIGDDINDLEAMQVVGFKGCPLDASTDIARISDFVSSKNGGDGSVREIIDFILKQNSM